MEFCPKCGGMLIPEKVGRSRKLVCHSCGFKGKIRRRAPYKIREEGKGPREIPVLVEESKKKRRPAEREYELEPPEYYEEFYE